MLDMVIERPRLIDTHDPSVKFFCFYLLSDVLHQDCACRGGRTQGWIGLDVRVYYESFLEHRAWILFDWVFIVIRAQVYDDVSEQFLEGVFVVSVHVDHVLGIFSDVQILQNRHGIDCGFELS